MSDKTLGEKIRDQRIKEGLSVSEAAEKAGISRDSWYKIERGERWPNVLPALTRMAKAIRCSPKNLV